ncbi:DUF6234 family protein [Streptomyces sp. NPDC004296]|uniref:DUF6234 family protein n=1 Tax=Streptomyces sp. NPDC004296 TaxID=3364697 RepID=UPI0036B837FB
MLTRVVDVLAGVALTAVEVAALVAFWFCESLKLWAAQGQQPRPGSAVRLWLVLTAGPAGAALVGLLAFRVVLPATGLTQALITAALVGILLLGLGTETSRWVTRSFARHLGKRRNAHAGRDARGHGHDTDGRDTYERDSDKDGSDG